MPAAAAASAHRPARGGPHSALRPGGLEPNGRAGLRACTLTTPIPPISPAQAKAKAKASCTGSSFFCDAMADASAKASCGLKPARSCMACRLAHDSRRRRGRPAALQQLDGGAAACSCLQVPRAHRSHPHPGHPPHRPVPCAGRLWWRRRRLAPLQRLLRKGGALRVLGLDSPSTGWMAGQPPHCWRAAASSQRQRFRLTPLTLHRRRLSPKQAAAVGAGATPRRAAQRARAGFAWASWLWAGSAGAGPDSLASPAANIACRALLPHMPARLPQADAEAKAKCEWLFRSAGRGDWAGDGWAQGASSPPCSPAHDCAAFTRPQY